jgi:hypothetical protein
MKRSHLELGSRQKSWLYGLTGLLWLSGTVWLVLPQAHPAGPLSMRIHGAAAMGFLMAFGALLFEHVPRGWKDGRQRPTGAPLIILCGTLAVTGWGLYYLGNEAIRHWTRWIHSAFGVLFPIFLALHIWLGRQTGKR